jgi:hypothetical protein
VHTYFELYVINVYISNFNQKKKFLSDLNKIIINLISSKPEATVLVAGDFNTKDPPMKHLFNFSGLEATFQRTVQNKIVKSKTDWIFCNKPHIN